VARRIDLGVNGPDDAVLADDVADALRGAGVRAVAGPVGEADGAALVAQKREVEIELLREGPVVGDGVEADADDLGVLLLELAELVAEPATLGGSSRRVGLRVEPEHDVLAAEVREADGLPAVIRRGEFRSLIALLQHSGDLNRESP
jgi:hypothetical protein